MPEENLQFPIPNSVLEPYIKQAVSTAIVSALGDGTKLVAMAVHHALSTKVTSEGRVDPRYTSDNKYALVDIVAANKIREIAKKTIEEMAEQMRPKIKIEVEKYLKTQSSALAKSIIDSIINGLKCNLNLNIKIE